MFITIICYILGLLFTTFGYLILFKGKYNLINGFESYKRMNDKRKIETVKHEFKSKADYEAYAKRLGAIEFIGGIAYLLFGIINLFLRFNKISLVIMIGIFVVQIGFITANSLKHGIW